MAKSASEFLGVGKTIPELPEGVTDDPEAVSVDSWDHSVTPSGIEVRYQNEPKRKYQIKYSDPGMYYHGRDRILYPDIGWYNNQGELHPEGDWAEVPSVTTILDVLEKGGLSWWGMKIGIQGVITMHNEHGRDLLVGDTVEDWETLLKKNKLTVNHIRNKAGDRGNNVHQALEYWAINGTKPDPDFYPSEERGYVSGLLQFLEDSRIEPIQSEVKVGSIEYGYAGRPDLLAYYGGFPVCTHTTPTGRNAKTEELEPGVFMFDLKTSKDVYSSNHIQLAAYKHANVECGYQPSDIEAIVRVTNDGRYEVVVGRATLEDFLNVKSVYDTLQRLK